VAEFASGQKDDDRRIYATLARSLDERETSAPGRGRGIRRRRARRLDGLGATTHWLAAADLARRHPSIDLDANVLYVDNGRVLTSAGAAAGFDLCIHMVRRDLGAHVAVSVARLTVMPLERAGGQAQFVEHAPPSEAPGAMTPLLTWIEQNLSRELPLPVIARRGDKHENAQPSFSRAGRSDAGRVARTRTRASRATAARND